MNRPASPVGGSSDDEQVPEPPMVVSSAPPADAAPDDFATLCRKHRLVASVRLEASSVADLRQTAEGLAEEVRSGVGSAPPMASHRTEDARGPAAAAAAAAPAPAITDSLERQAARLLLFRDVLLSPGLAVDPAGRSPPPLAILASEKTVIDTICAVALVQESPSWVSEVVRAVEDSLKAQGIPVPDPASLAAQVRRFINIAKDETGTGMAPTAADYLAVRRPSLVPATTQAPQVDATQASTFVEEWLAKDVISHAFSHKELAFIIESRHLNDITVARLRLWLNVLVTGEPASALIPTYPDEQPWGFTCPIQLPFKDVSRSLPQATDVHPDLPDAWNVSRVLLDVLFTAPSGQPKRRQCRVLATDLKGWPLFLAKPSHATMTAAFDFFLEHAPRNITRESVSPVFVCSTDLARQVQHPRLMGPMGAEASEQQTKMVRKLHAPISRICTKMRSYFVGSRVVPSGMGMNKHAEALRALVQMLAIVHLREAAV